MYNLNNLILVRTYEIDFRPRVEHTRDTTCPSVVFKNKTSCSFLNSFKFVNIILSMGRPYCCYIVQNWFDIYLISIKFYSSITLIQIPT